MIYFEEILKFARGIPPETIEKDYCITWLLQGLSKLPICSDLTFYGGTALKKIYFSNYRFSEDLDFISQKRLPQENILSAFDSIYDNLLEHVNIKFSTKKESIALKEDRLQFIIVYDGLPEITFEKTIKIDINLRAELLERATPQKILSVYSDKTEISGKIPTYSLEAISAEKLSAVIDSTRMEPRDIYDLYYLLDGNKLDRKEIMRLLKKKLGFIPTATTLLSSIEEDAYRQLWEIRLKNQVAKLEEFDQTRKEVKKLIDKLYATG